MLIFLFVIVELFSTCHFDINWTVLRLFKAYPQCAADLFIFVLNLASCWYYEVSFKKCNIGCFVLAACALQVVDCRVCGDPHSRLRFAFVEFADECKLEWLEVFLGLLNIQN